MVMLLGYFGPYGLVFMTISELCMTVITTLDFPVIVDGQFTCLM
jgi:hypothetical protein